MNIAAIQTLTVKEQYNNGWILSDGTSAQAKMPFRPDLKRVKAGMELEVFVYPGKEGDLIATTNLPKALPGQFTCLQVADVVSNIGAFMDWGIEKDLFIPFKEQNDPMLIGESYPVFIMYDKLSNKIMGSGKIELYVDNEELTVAEKEEVDLLIYKETDLGYSVVVNNYHEGLIYADEVFQPVKVGDQLKGYVKNIREDHKLDISITPLGYQKTIDVNTDTVLNKLRDFDGFMDVNDKSDPEIIYALFKMSKKAFKKAIGFLYKEKKIEITPEGIKLITD